MEGGDRLPEARPKVLKAAPISFLRFKKYFGVFYGLTFVVFVLLMPAFL